MDAAPHLAATPCTCAMLRRTTRRVTRIYDRALRPVGLRLTQYSVLAHVARGQGLNITDLAGRLATDRSTLTRNLRPLERSGWIRIARGADPRQRAITLTGAGRAKYEQALPLWEAAERDFRRALGSDDVAALRGLLDRAYLRGSEA